MTIRCSYFSAVILIIFSFFIGLATTQHALADGPVSTLTKENVSEFIKKTSEITSGKNLEMSSEEVIKYLELHLDERARFKSSLTYNIPGYPVQETSLALNKEDFIESIKEGANAIKEYDNNVKVRSVQISKDQQKATVKTTGYETGMMPVSAAEGGTKLIPIEGESSCDQIIMIGESGYIQMYTANCKTQINFRNF